MSFLSNIYNSAKSYINNVIGGAKIVGGAIANAFSNTPQSSQTASVVSAGQTPTQYPQTYLPNISTPQGIGQTQPNGSINLLNSKGQPTGGVIPANSGGYTASTVPAGANPIYGSTTSSVTAGPNISSAGFLANYGNSGASGINSTSLNSGSFSSAPSITLPPVSSVKNPGTINNGGLINSSGQYGLIYDPQTNQFLSKGDIAEGLGGKDLPAQVMDYLKNNLPQRENVYEDPQIQAQIAEVNARKQEVANYTAQLNSVVAQQNSDLLNLRTIGSKEGVTESVYGQQAAEINREAAVRALPLQAQISAAQGNLNLAQDYLTQLTTWKKEAYDNEYNYQVAQYGVIKDYLTTEEKKIADAQQNSLTQVNQFRKDNVDQQDTWAKYAVQNGRQDLVTSIYALDPQDPNFRNLLASTVSQLTKSSTPSNSSTLSKSDIQGGATKAGLSVSDFQALDPDVQNYFANAPASKIKGVSDAINNVASGTEKADAVKAEIDASNNPQSVKDYLKAQVDAVAPQQSSGGGFWSRLSNYFNG